ncbi:putative leucine-rich repeat receptor-like serine/threonine-protein kinase [Acorus gramineus]|uniref:Leucine-rich repeat receptor-like serine/threonine-protein kinase n=1 Tax=Acorus gramineus TaxID=55184 RepID=A0AAV9A0W7_ACOGR|nr:putative leucine-rich repeat receptor-like serine/threonine-protein kinase [Acorus gramineus]
MSLSLFLLSLLTIFNPLHALPPPRGFSINCGSSNQSTVGGVEWITDDGFTTAGNKSTLRTTPGLMPVLSTLRYFPDTFARKYCFVIPVAKGAKYLVRTTYFYGAFDGGDGPPVFDQIVGGTRWSEVNTTENFSKGLTSYYEIVVRALGKTMSVCLARNSRTTSSPFISALELEYLEDSMYNSTDFDAYALSTIARHQFGHEGRIVSYPDDLFNRYWEPFMDNANPIVESHSNVSSDDFWNLPPTMAFQKGLTTSRGKSLNLNWPAMPLPLANYYIALYFQDNRTPSPYSWRVFDVSVNGNKFYTALNVSTVGVVVYGMNWPLSGQTQITLTPKEGSPVGPVINAGEVFQIVPIHGRTRTRDVIAMEELVRSLKNPPSDWSGDPCLPRENSWTGVQCSEGKLIRVISLNLTNYGLSGSLDDNIRNLTAINHIWLGGNKLTGPIPDMRSLNGLVSLHLENNQFEGRIPESLGDLENLREVFLQNNHLQGPVPQNLKNRSGIDIRI